MSRLRAVLLIALAALAAVWAYSSGTPGGGGAAVGTPRPDGAPIPARQPAVFDLQVLPQRIDAHRASLAEAPLNGRRNPFAFSSEARASREPRAAQPLAPALQPADAPAEPTAATATLIGIVDRTEDGQAVRVAVVSFAGELYYVRAGERVGSRYETIAVSADAVEVKDLTDGSTRKLALQ